MSIRLSTRSDELVIFAEGEVGFIPTSPFFLWVVLGGSENQGDF